MNERNQFDSLFDLNYLNISEYNKSISQINLSSDEINTCEFSESLKFISEVINRILTTSDSNEEKEYAIHQFLFDNEMGGLNYYSLFLRDLDNLLNSKCIYKYPSLKNKIESFREIFVNGLKYSDNCICKRCCKYREEN